MSLTLSDVLNFFYSFLQTGGKIVEHTTKYNQLDKIIKVIFGEI